MIHPFTELRRKLQWDMQGLPGALLSAIMLAMAGIISFVAIKAPTATKAIVLAWIVLP